MEVLIYDTNIVEEDSIRIAKEKYEEIKDKEGVRILIDIQTPTFKEDALKALNELHQAMGKKITKSAIICDPELFRLLLRNFVKFIPRPELFSTSAQAEEWLRK